MSETEHDRVRSIFSSARKLPAAERAAFLDDACGDDRALRDEVVSLLSVHAETSSVLDTRALRDRLGEVAAASIDATLPERIGAFRVNGVIGEGGMGVVYEAEQDDPDRRVALKVIRPGMVTPGLLRRFRHEARILGQLHHPGIAQIYQAGTADDGSGGRPFFAMELVRGRALLDHAREVGLDAHDRLELVARICDALHHAHRKGIVHRDLKPANVLVIEAESPGAVRRDVGQPKVLDFGIARATDADVNTVTLRTDVGQVVGTLPYMSPEQAAGDPDAIDARSDVYSVGVLAFELLTGRLPYAVEGKLIHEAVRIIREEEPTRLSSIDRGLRGDVETILATALTKEKARRYQSAADLAADIRRYLHDEPITARPVSVVYQFRKFARRNRAVVAGVTAGIGIAFVALVGATAYSLRQAGVATEAGRLALRQAYHSTIRAAETSLDAGDPISARRLLDETDPALRGWEWNHLDAQFDRSLLVVEAGERLLAAAMTSDNRHVVAMSISARLTWWDATTGAPVGSVVVEVDQHRSAAITQRGDALFIVHGQGGTDVSAWALEPGVARPSGAWKVPSEALDLVVTPDGDRVVARLRRTAVTWRPAEGMASAQTLDSGRPPSRVVVSDDGRYAAMCNSSASSGERGYVFDLVSGELVVNTYVERSFSSLAISPDGSFVAGGGANKRVHLQPVADPTAVEFRAGHGGIPWRLAFSPDGRRLVSGSDDLTLRVWDVHDASEDIVFTGHRGPILEVGFSADGSMFFSRGIETVRAWPTQRRARDDILHEHGSYVYALALSPDGRHVYTSDWKGIVTILDARSGEPLRTISAGSRITALAVSPDGEMLAVGGPAGVSLRRIDSLSPPHVLEQYLGEIDGLAFSPDGARVVASRRNGRFTIWSVTDGLELASGTRKAGAWGGTCFAPDGRQVALASGAGALIVDAATCEPVRTLPTLGPVLDVAWSPDGRQIATVGHDRRLYLFDAASGDLQSAHEGHSSLIYAVTFSPDGTRVATGSNDTSIGVWDVETGRPIARLRGHGDYVHDVAFSHDGTMLVSGSGDATTRRWSTRSGGERRVRAAVSRAQREAVRPLVSRLAREHAEPAALAAAIRVEPTLEPSSRRAALDLAFDPAWWALEVARDPFDGFAIEFAGEDGHVFVSDDEAFRFDETFTLEAWVFPSRDGDDAVRTFLSREGEYQMATGPAESLQVTVAPRWAWRRVPARLPKGKWTHVAMVHAPDSLRLFINGRLAEAIGSSGKVGDAHPDEQELHIGGRQRMQSGFQGLMDDVRIWRIARDGAAIRADMLRALRGDEPGLVGSWRFDEGEGDIAHDQAGRHHATLRGGTWRATRADAPPPASP